jgi:integrase
MKLSEFAPKFLALHKDNKPTYLKNKTAMLEREIVPRFGEQELNAITKMDVDLWVAYLRNTRKLRNKTINNYLTILSNLLNTARSYKLITPADIPEIAKQREEEVFTEYLSEEQVPLFIGAFTEPLFRALALFGVNTGLRIGEIRALQWEHVDDRRNVIVVRQQFVGRGWELSTPKGRKSREVPMNRNVKDALKTLDRTTKFVFSRPRLRFETETALSYKAIESAWRYPRRVLRAPWVGRHTMRHTFASHLILAGASIVEVKELLGHVDIKTTMRYAHLRPSALHRTVSFLDK